MDLTLLVPVLLFSLLQPAVSVPSNGYYANIAESDQYIINGDDVEKGRWPWQLSLEVFDPEFRHTCGASLLDERHALTAAHCVDGRFPDMDFRVMIGASHRGDDDTPSDAEDIVNVTGAIIHELYRCPECDGSWPNDIALLYLETDVEFNEYVQPATLGNPNIDYEGRECYASGWGKLSGTDEDVPVKLQEIEIDVVTTEECRSLMPIDGTNRIQPIPHVCIYDYRNVTDEEKRNVCSGDSGGPLQCLNDDDVWHVIGAASWVVAGPGIDSSCNPAYPGIYAQAINYLLWIQEKIEDPSWKP